FQAEDGIRDKLVTGVQTCALPICSTSPQGCPTSSRPITRSLTKRPRRWTEPDSSCRRISPVQNASPKSERKNASCPHNPEVAGRSEEHTSELQSLAYLVCRLLLEK